MSDRVCRPRCAARNENDTPPEILVARWAAEQHGVITLAQLHACGLDRAAVLRRVRAGTLHPVHRGVYAVGHPALTLTGRFVAAVLACGDGASLSFLAWHRDGMRVTSPARTLLDLAAVLPEPALRRAARQAQAERRVNVRQLREILARSNGHHGVSALRAIVDDGPSPTRSDLEDALLDLLDDAGIERPEVNAPLRLDGRRIVPDYLWRARRLAIEADSRRWHDDPLTRRNDADKQAILEASDYRVLRITDHQIADRPQQTLARVRAALAGN